jgi:hypothetical protein
VQRVSFVRRYGVSDLFELAQHKCLPPAILEEIAKLEHAEQQRFVDQLHEAAAGLPRIHSGPEAEEVDRILHLYLVDKTALKRIARRLRDQILEDA